MFACDAVCNEGRLPGVIFSTCHKLKLEVLDLAVGWYVGTETCPYMDLR